MGAAAPLPVAPAAWLDERAGHADALWRLDLLTLLVLMNDAHCAVHLADSAFVAVAARGHIVNLCQIAVVAVHLAGVGDVLCAATAATSVVSAQDLVLSQVSVSVTHLAVDHGTGHDVLAFVAEVGSRGAGWQYLHDALRTFAAGQVVVKPGLSGGDGLKAT